MRRILTGLLVLGTLVLAPAAPAVAAADTLVVQVRASQVTLNPDGTVSVPVRVRCGSRLDAFELGISVTQGATGGFVFRIGEAFPACTGKWQQATFTADSGAFAPGTATVNAYVAAYDTVEDHDLLAEDSATVRLR